MPTITLMLAVAVLGGAAGNADASNDDNLQTVKAWLDKILEGIPVKIRPQKVVRIEDENVQKTFPDDLFYSVSFATWPIAPRLPKELSYETLVRVRQGGLIEPIRDATALRSFLAQSLSGIQDEKQAATAGLASLRLTSAVATASAFEKPDVSVVQQGGAFIATARAAASAPARGEVEIQLQFGADGTTTPETIKTDDRSRRGPPGGS